MTENTKTDLASIGVMMAIAAIVLIAGFLLFKAFEGPSYEVRVICSGQCDGPNSTKSAEALFAYECCYDACIESTEKVLDQDCALLEAR